MKWKNNKGFSLAELLVVVAIIVILMGVTFVAVQNHQRSMTRLEFDGIAKEIFIAAQNHLTSAESQGYLQSTEYGNVGTLTGDKKDGVYFILKGDSMLDLMLPFASIDETVRAGGTYIIRYQPSSGTVLDVFYSFPRKSSMLTISGKALDSTDYPTLMGDETNYREGGERNRERYPDGVVGWYGSVEPLPIGERIDAPELIIHNEEILWVEIRSSAKNDLNGTSLNLIVKGDVSGTQIAFDLKSMSDLRVKQLNDSADGSKVYAVILDDITTSQMHFSDLYIVQNGTRKEFNPGENISVEAVAFTNNALTNIGYSGKNTTNSLFTDIETTTAEGNTTYSALIENFRHFENLDKTISGFNEKTAYKSKDDEEVTIASARQITDLNWTGALTDKAFVQRVYHLKDDFIGYPNSSGPNKLSIYDKDASALISDDDKLYPVSPDYVLDYNGGSHKISNVAVEHNSDSGLFGTLTSSSKVKNLELIDFDITATSGNAGALVGTANGTEITNVVAHNSEDNDSKFDNDDTTAGKKPNVTATGAAGGLIGSMSGGSVTKSAAAVYVKGGTEAGGLIGSVTGDNNTVTACYSGGHTISGKPDGAEPKYDGHADVYPVRYDPDHCNVTAASGTAGGLIGNAGTATISNSYSTCSASGTKAGGFIGTGGSATNCYCTGLVFGTDTEGAFAASDTSADNSCKYFEIINERRNKDGSGNPASGYHYLKAFGNDTDGESGKEVGKIDDTVADYGTFVGASTAWDLAEPYNSKLTDYYGDNFNLKTVFQIPLTEKSKTTGEDAKLFVATHYGDWPAPEEFIFN